MLLLLLLLVVGLLLLRLLLLASLDFVVAGVVCAVVGVAAPSFAAYPNPTVGLACDVAVVAVAARWLPDNQAHEQTHTHPMCLLHLEKRKKA